MQPSLYSRTSRAEQLIAAGRALLAIVSLMAIWLDPTEPSHHATIAYELLGGYALYACVLWLGIARAAMVPRGIGLVTHVGDLVFIASLQYFTSASSSPFFVYFLFTLVAGTMRWQLRGVVWTGAATLASLAGLGLASVHMPGEQLDVTRIVVRGAYLVVMTGLLAYLGAYEARLRAERARLTGWPPTVTAEADLPSMLRHAAGVLGVPRLIMIWDRADEPWRYVMTCRDGTVDTTSLPPDSLPVGIPPPLAGTVFLWDNAGARRPRVLYRRGGRFARHDGIPIDRALVTRWNITRLLALPLASQHAGGWLFALDKPRMTSDDLLLGELVAREVSARLDRADLLRSLAEAGAARERERLAGTLHDGLLQSLTGIDLKLEQLKQLAPSALPAIEGLQAIVAAEHAEVRQFVAAGERNNADGAAFDLEQNLSLLPQRIGSASGAEVIVRPDPGLDRVPAPLARQIYLMVREAIANAMKHSGAKAVRVTVHVAEQSVRIVVVDDGHGFPFTGLYTDEELDALHVGPQSVLRRVRALTGRVQLESADGGVRLKIELPLTPACHGG